MGTGFRVTLSVVVNVSQGRPLATWKLRPFFLQCLSCRLLTFPLLQDPQCPEQVTPSRSQGERPPRSRDTLSHGHLQPQEAQISKDNVILIFMAKKRSFFTGNASPELPPQRAFSLAPGFLTAPPVQVPHRSTL